ncbi:hypothetical protein BDV96DRAFT_488974 [Lophiotrema nucula]|uniref:Uncharacterized protein n=1 Tax=Lophiotrema nucula TaxID=690887 RepID=A0A6A5ZG08_9PLEO|nr:hypothetical protein BDV96DRAFT_488974 [Lophiotrema nucula]
MPNFQVTSDGVIEENRLKGLVPAVDGKKLRQIRLQGFDDPDTHLHPEIFALELWKRIVEVYSRTAITKSEDKLVALSGMAGWMARRIGTPAQPATYVAGLWTLHLASQLLWRVEPTFRAIDGQFEHLTVAPDKYRAPSFSWASLDAHEGNGIVYGDITDRDLFIDIEEAQIRPESFANVYGTVVSGHVILRGKLRKVKLSMEDKGRFCWQFVDREMLNEEKHTNMYLDCYSRDKECIFGPDADVFVLPAAKGERTASPESKYFVCLLLQLKRDWTESGPVFRRIGLTKLSPWADNRAMQEDKVLEAFPSDVDMPHQGYDPETGTHRIVLV